MQDSLDPLACGHADHSDAKVSEHQEGVLCDDPLKWTPGWAGGRGSSSLPGKMTLCYPSSLI